MSAVSGKSRSHGCTAAGKRAVEKNTPEATNIGSCTRLIRPFTVWVFSAREASKRPMPAKASAPSSETPIKSGSEPATPTLNASQPKPSSTGSSRKRNNARISTKEVRNCARDIGVATMRLSSLRVRISTTT